MTILDEVADRDEHRVFQVLYEETEPVARLSRVNEFLRRFPSSWLLAPVYEAGARASFELGDYGTGLYRARESLQLYPENALLTGSMAAVHANRGETKAAQDRARETLEYLHRFRPPAGVSKREWLAIREKLERAAQQVLKEARISPVKRREREARGSYAGSEACRTCHNAQWAAWKETGMAKMLRRVEHGQVIGDFAKLGTFEESGLRPARGGSAGGNYYVELQRSGGRWDSFRVEYTIGSKWQQAYAVKSASGELHVLPIQYNKLTNTWINYWRLIDPPGAVRGNVQSFHEMREVTSYQKNCAPCHTSQIEEHGFLEPGVNCEMCHGPSAAHAKGAPSQSSFKRMDHRDYVEVCAQCHAQSAIREPQGFPPRYQRRPYSEFSRKAFYRDGRFRETTFIVEAFERSACFQRGKAHCGHCHHPHPKDASRNPAALKFAADSDQMCLQCHSSSFARTAHTQHTEGEGSRCVSCHMPKIMNSLSFAARTHQIDDRPRAEPTLRFGQQESPNACLLCHAVKDGTWLAEKLRNWIRPLPSQ